MEEKYQPASCSLLIDNFPSDDPVQVFFKLDSVNIITCDDVKNKNSREYLIDGSGENLFVGSQDESDDGISCFSRDKRRISFKADGSNDEAFSMTINNRHFSDTQITRISSPSYDFIGRIKQTGRGSKSCFKIENSRRDHIYSVNKSKDDTNFDFDVLHKESEETTKIQFYCSNGLPCRTIEYPNGSPIADKILLTVCGILVANIPVDVKKSCEPKQPAQTNNEIKQHESQRL